MTPPPPPPRPKKPISGTKTLRHWDTLEPWQQDNEYIHHHYRPITRSHVRSIASLFYLHNQTVNIYSHLLGALGFSLDYYLLATAHYATEDRVLLACFLLGCVICFGSSAYFHLVGNHSREIYDAWLTMDFFGIICLIVGTSFPLAWYSYPCRAGAVRGCWGFVTLVAAICVVLCTAPNFRQRSWRRYRAAVFTLFALVGFFPLFHSVSLYGLEQANRQMGWWWFALGGVCYVLGAAVYAARIPERLLPGAFDVWGSSHQIFHLMVVSGAVLHFNGILASLDYHHDPITSVIRQCIAPI